MRVFGGVLDEPRQAGSEVRAFGEMVALLWHQGNVAGAIALESLWNDLAQQQRFSLLCAYPTTGLTAAELGDVNEVCRLHSVVHPPSSYESLVLPDANRGRDPFRRFRTRARGRRGSAPVRP